MYTKEDIEKAKQYLDNEGYGTGSNFTLNMVSNLMAEYAAKNCVIPAVVGRSEQLSCPRCRHTGIDTDKDGLNYCRSCSHYWRAT